VLSPRRCPDGGYGGATVPRRQILAVDDDAIIPEIIRSFLGQSYEVTTATTGVEALARVRRGRVELVVLDHRLPDRTGLDVLIELRSTHPNLPVIMLTGYGSEWICASAFKLGVADYLQKPVSAVDLVAAVQRILLPGLARGEPLSESHLPKLPAPPSLPIQRVIGVIQQRYWDQLSLAALARQVGMSKYRLSHRFRDTLGVTFRDYLLKVRLERAKVLLSAAGRVSITEVAHDVGFGDLARFDKVFKRYTGFTPSAYRSSKIPGRSNK
jgi:two-component system, response regulator YesN